MYVFNCIWNIESLLQNYILSLSFKPLILDRIVKS